MQIFHITSLRNAYSIVKSGRYIPCYSNPLAQDSGLNAGILGEELVHQAFEFTGARLILQWDGPTTTHNSFPLPKNVLLNSLPWRVMISHGTTEGLTAVRIEVEDQSQYDEIIGAPPFWALTQRMKSYWRSNKIRSLNSDIETYLITQPKIIVG